MIPNDKTRTYLRLSAQILKAALERETSPHRCIEHPGCRIDGMRLNDLHLPDEEIRAFFMHFGGEPVTLWDVLFYFAGGVLYPCRGTLRYREAYADIWHEYTQHLDAEPVIAAASLLYAAALRACPPAHSCRVAAKGNVPHRVCLRETAAYSYGVWVCLMNRVDHAAFERFIAKLEQPHPVPAQGEPLSLVWRKAAAIRLYLYRYVTETAHFSRFGDLDGMYRWLESRVLGCTSRSLLPLAALTEELSMPAAARQTDYAQTKAQPCDPLQGERLLLAQVLEKIRFRVHGADRAGALLSLYLRMKQQFRSELTQSRARTGLCFFDAWQSREHPVVPPALEEALAADTVAGLVGEMPPAGVQLCLLPAETAEDTAAEIRMYDRALRTAGVRAAERGRFSYAFRLVEDGERRQPELQCRDFVSRASARVHTGVIRELRAEPSEIAPRIGSVSAAAVRPEAFAPAFRHLQCDARADIPRLTAVYDVGAGHCDLVDALRAVEEAVLFWELRAGSRIGQAACLEIAPGAYYAQRCRQTLPMQVWLDNAVWMYAFLRRRQAVFAGSSRLMRFLEEQFAGCFGEVYQEALTAGYAMQRQPAGLRFVPESRREWAAVLRRYALSWLLRGDDPELYVSGSLQRPASVSEGYRLCRSLPEMDTARDSTEAAYLYALYHYHPRVKARGEIPVTVTLPDAYIRGAEEIQKALRQDLTARGIVFG